MKWETFWERRGLPDEMFVAPGYDAEEEIEWFASVCVHEACRALEDENAALRERVEKAEKTLTIMLEKT